MPPGRAITDAAKRSGLPKRATARTVRHGPAAHPIGAGDDIRAVREPFGREDVRATIVYAHVPNRGGRGVVSPADFDLPEPGVTHDNARALSRDVSGKH